MAGAIFVALLLMDPSQETGVPIVGSSTTVTTETPVTVGWEAGHIERNCLLSRRLDDRGHRTLVLFQWNPENLTRAVPALSLSVTVVTKAALVGDLRIRTRNQEATLSTIVLSGEGAHASATAQEADATLAQVRDGAALRILYRVGEGAERVVEMDAADMDVAHVMFDACIKAVSPAQVKEPAGGG